MRRLIYRSCGVLELLVSGVLLVLVQQLPGPAFIKDKLSRVERVGQQSSRQIEQLRSQLEGLRQRYPEMQALAGSLQQQLEIIGDQLGSLQLDAGALTAVGNGLGDVADGLEGVSNTLEPKSIAQLAEALQTAAAYLEETVAPSAVKAAEQLDTLAKDLPAMQEAVKESRSMLGKSRATLVLLGLQDSVELLETPLPEPVARLTEDLPQMSRRLAKELRDTSRLKEVAGLLRQTRQGLVRVLDSWPDLRQKLGRSAQVLRTVQRQLGQALEQRTVFETALKQTLRLAQTFSATLPLFAAQLENDLREQEQSLGQLGRSLEDATAMLPECSRKAVTVVQLTRLLLGLLAVLFGLHGVYRLAETQPGPPRTAV